MNKVELLSEHKLRIVCEKCTPFFIRLHELHVDNLNSLVHRSQQILEALYKFIIKTPVSFKIYVYILCKHLWAFFIFIRDDKRFKKNFIQFYINHKLTNII